MITKTIYIKSFIQSFDSAESAIANATKDNNEFKQIESHLLRGKIVEDISWGLDFLCLRLSDNSYLNVLPKQSYIITSLDSYPIKDPAINYQEVEYTLVYGKTPTDSFRWNPKKESEDVIDKRVMQLQYGPKVLFLDLSDGDLLTVSLMLDVTTKKPILYWHFEHDG